MLDLRRSALRVRSAGLRAGPAAVALAAATALVWVAAVDPEEPGHYPPCPLLSVTGLYCPGCGSLRALHALAHGDLLQALDRNPLTVLAVPYLVAAWGIWTLRVYGRPVRTPVLPGWAIRLLLVAVLLFAVVRNLPGQAWAAP